MNIGTDIRLPAPQGRVATPYREDTRQKVYSPQYKHNTLYNNTVEYVGIDCESIS